MAHESVVWTMSDKPIIDDLDIQPVEDTPPRRTAVASTTRKTKAAPPYREGKLIDPLTKVYAAFGLGLFPFAPRAAMAIAENAETCAIAWDDWARTSPAVRRMLYPLLNVSGGAKVVGAHIPILLAVLSERMEGSAFAEKIESWLKTVTMPTMDAED